MQTRIYPEVSDDFGHWLAGFIDGEGCFSVSYNGQRQRYPSLKCTFRIALRSDDTPLLEECRRQTGLGVVYRQRPFANQKWNPSAMWHVAHKSDSARLIEILDRFPLRSKKARDYAVWREAVIVRNSRRGTRYDAAITAQLEELRIRLMEGRKWQEHDSVLVPEPSKLYAVTARSDVALF